jgi:hypothetical protein
LRDCLGVPDEVLLEGPAFLDGALYLAGWDHLNVSCRVAQITEFLPHLM